MMSEQVNKKFLLIAFRFPPYAGVGGFRWSKLCKYLARMGHEIHVVTVNWRQQDPNVLLEDVQYPNIIIHRIRSGYPHNLRHRMFKSRLINDIKNGIFVYIVNRCFFSGGEAQRWGRYLLPYCEKLLEEEDIEVVVATGGPFQANRWAAALKRQNQRIRLIQDFRDPWADDMAKSWSESKLVTVRTWQRTSVEAADCVVAVTTGLLKLYLDGTEQRNGYVISNGYDPDSNVEQKNATPLKSDFSFIYIGDIPASRQEPLRQFLGAVRRIRPQIPDVRVTLVGGYRKTPQRLFPDLVQQGVLKLKPYVRQRVAFEMVKRHTYALQLNAKVYPYLVSTKIYEYGMLRVPTVSLNYGGEVDQLIRRYDLGYSVNVARDDIATFLMQLHRQPQRQFSFDVAEFAYDDLAARYSRLING